MKVLTTILDFLATICIILLFVRFALIIINRIFNLDLQWYFLEDIPYMSTILSVLVLALVIPSEIIKDKSKM
ncbi:Uncharacterised protein [Staphylococcus xylosus]|uniref:epilancin biosynthesis-related protein ElxI1 n=1 Tax=Staphylococcus xylosus TaxID=1288 RepID=UPI00085C8044|nr:hypothetical protein [Staphylococcus xylosus]SCU36904.1 Uncharacterised protein [Staphylococcus xylosus]